jgi:hypothetical protein
MNPSKTELRDPAVLQLHPLQKKYIPEPDRESAEWLSFVDAQSAAGPDGIPALVITIDGRIMDGGRRWRAAKQLGWPEMQVVIRSADDAAAIIVESLLGQRNMQRCSKVYIALTLLPEFVESAEHRRLEHIKKGVKTLEKPLSSNSTKPESLRSLGEKFGVGKDTIARAFQVIKIFAANPAIKAYWEPRLLSGEKNLWNVLSAVGGAGADQGRRAHGVEAAQLEFWNSPFAALKNAAPAWKKLDDGAREHALADWRKAALKLPEDLRAGMRKVLEEIA